MFFFLTNILDRNTGKVKVCSTILDVVSSRARVLAVVFTRLTGKDSLKG